MKPTIFLDFDGVLITTKQYYNKKKINVDEKLIYPFDPKCVKVLNLIIEKTNPVIICSSDWKYYFNLNQLNDILKINGVNGEIIDITPSLWGIKYKNLFELENCRADEIKTFAEKNKIANFVAVDDLNLYKWLPNNFVWCSNEKEGIKQSGIKEKIIKILEK